MTFSKSAALAAALGLVSLALLVSQPAVAADSSAPIESFTLTNGMQVVLVESHRAPAVTHMLWYRVGAADDYPGRSGLAHYNEHMMFQGTEKIKSGAFSEIIEKNGGRTNASTSHDYTLYYVSIAKEHLPLVMELEADRMLHLQPSKENFAKEREVIIEERRMAIENQPGALLGEEMQAMLYRNHPYHTPNIGWMHEMQALSREDVLAFHKQFYHPANATLVVAGDITRKELEPLAEKYYGRLPKGETYIRQWRSEPPSRAPRHITLAHVNVKKPELVRLYLAPGMRSADKDQALPGYVFSQVMGGGATSRLYQSLVVTQKIATQVSMNYNALAWGPGEVEIEAIPAEGITLPALEAALDAELAAFAKTPPTADEITRAKTLLKADTIFARDGTEGMARLLGVLLMSGLTPDYFNRWPSLIDAVTPEEVLSASKALTNPKASVTGYLVPEVEEK